MSWDEAVREGVCTQPFDKPDAEREWAYDRQSANGHFDKALDEALAKGWTVVSMKDDWKVVYAGDKK